MLVGVAVIPLRPTEYTILQGVYKTAQFGNVRLNRKLRKICEKFMHAWVSLRSASIFTTRIFCIVNVGVLQVTPRKNVCKCVNITEICIANVMSSVPNVVKNSK